MSVMGRFRGPSLSLHIAYWIAYWAAAFAVLGDAPKALE